MDYNVILAATWGRISGVDVFSTHLVRGLREQGIAAHILLTEPDEVVPDPMPLPSNIPVARLPVENRARWRNRWLATIRYLEDRAPCIYIPNYDWYHSCVSPTLSNRVGIVGIVHSDDSVHYEHVKRLGRYWNAIVAVSPAIAAQITTLNSTLAQRLVTLPYGVMLPSGLPEKRHDLNQPLRVVYAGRLVQHQKRVLDLPKIVEAALERGVSIELTIIGSGIEEEALRQACAAFVARGAVRFLGTLSNEHVLEVFAASDAFILSSDFEGLPVSLLEAMARGCIPVVSNIRSGIPELVFDGVNGYRVPIGNIQLFVDRLAVLQNNLQQRQQMARLAYRTVMEGRFGVQDMVQHYIAVFERVWDEISHSRYKRPRGRLLPPPRQLVGINLLSKKYVNYMFDLFVAEFFLSCRADLLKDPLR